MYLENRKRGVLKAVSAVVLSFAIAAGAVPGVDYAITVRADDEKSIAGLGTGPIGVPDEPETQDTAWSGSYVWYGSTAPNKYRVLAPSTETYNDSPTMLLDCDTILERKCFDDDSSTWNSSDLKGYLNGDEFLNNNDKFTAQEREAIASSNVAEHQLYTEDYEDRWFENYVGLGGEKIFLLDYEDVMRPSYGYYKKSGFDGSAWVNVKNHIKKEANGSPWYWWLRSRINVNLAGLVRSDGRIYDDEVDTDYIGVSPAFNINLSSVIFSSCVVGTPGQPGAEYKLTIKDDKLGITPGDIVRDGTTITVPYEITGDNKNEATQVSVLIMDSAYSAGTATTSGYTYTKLSVNSWNISGTGTFTLPDKYAAKTCGTDYHAYILAEDVIAGNSTDYASTPVEIIIPDINVPVSGVTISPKETELKPGASQTLTHTIAPDNATNKNVTWSTSKPSVATVDNDGKVTAVDEGEAIIHVNTVDGDFSDTCRVTVRNGSPVIEECTVTFDANGGMGDMDPQKAGKGEAIQLKANAFTRNGYTFTKWNSEPDGSGTDYDDKASVKLEKDMTLYAQWTEDKPVPPVEEEYTVTVTVSPEKTGTAKASVKSGKTGTKVTLKAVSKAGYKFKKWKVVSGGVTLADATKAKTTFTIKEANVKVKAIFAKIYEAPQPEIEPVDDDKIILDWWKVNEAEGYDIFMSRCNHGGKEISPKLVKTIEENKTFEWTATGLKPNKSYKAYIKAYVTDKNGKKKYISKSPLMHVYTAGGNRTYTNAKSVKLNTSDGMIKKGNKLTLKVKDTYKIKASVRKADRKKKILPDSHVKTLRYRSSDPGVATVSSKGKITAKKKGKCNIYVYAHNGVNKTIKLTVK